jgi:probable rRNA maturation factor
MEINVLIDEGLEGLLEEKWMQRIAEQALVAENSGTGIELGLVVTSQERVQQLNQSYLGRNEPTDVIAFSMLSDAQQTGAGVPPFITPPDGVTHLGEVIISYHQAVIQAAEQNHPVKREIATLIVHGVLHLLGYRDDNPELKHRMSARETEILAGMGELE